MNREKKGGKNVGVLGGERKEVYERMITSDLAIIGNSASSWLGQE